MSTSGGPTGTIAVYSAGCPLCQETLARVTQAAQGRARRVQVIERPIRESGAPQVRAIPAIAFANAIVFEGQPSPEQAVALVKHEELDSRVLEHSLTKSEALQHFTRVPQMAQAMALAREYYPVSLEFPLFLSAAISHIRDERTRLLLVANLYEEHGRLDPTQTHPELFRKYIRALGMEPGAMTRSSKDSPSERLITRFSTVCQEGPDFRALAMLYAFELLFSPACALIQEGVKRLPLAPEAGVFFELHAAADVLHAEQLRLALFQAAESEEDWRVAVDTAEEAGQLLYTLFDTAVGMPDGSASKPLAR